MKQVSGKDLVQVRTKASRSDTRTQNRQFVLQQIFSEAPTSRAEIVRSTGLTAATVSDLVADLMAEGIVTEVGTAPSSGGKPPTLVDIDAPNLTLIVVDLSGSSWRGELRTARHDVLATVKIPHGDRRGDDVVRTVIELIDELTAASPVPPLGVGVGTPGVVTDSGVVVEAANLGWSNLPLADILADATGHRIQVVNDARATAVAEFLLGDHATGNLLVVKFGRGVGSGIILDRNVYRGESSAAGEIGHIAVIPRATEHITLEQAASTTAIARQLGHDLGIPFSGRPSRFIAAHVDDDAAVTSGLVARLGEDIATVLASVVGTLDVHRIVLSGPITTFGDALLGAVDAGLARRLLPALSASVTVSYGHVDEKAAVASGVATYVLRQELGVA